MSSARALVRVLPYGFIALLASCARGDGRAALPQGRYEVRVLAEGIDPTGIPERFAVDFDGDGLTDPLVMTDTSISILLNGGHRFDYKLSDSAGLSGRRIWDIAVMSLNARGDYPSIILATAQNTPERWFQPVIQQVIQNERGTLSPKSLAAHSVVGVRRFGAYPLTARGVDCARLGPHRLPTCFYASYGQTDVEMGLSRLIQFDVEEGFRHLATDSISRVRLSAWIARPGWVLRRWADSALRARVPAWSAIGRTASVLEWSGFGLDSVTVDSILAAHMPAQGRSVADTLLALASWYERLGPRERIRALTRMDREAFDSALDAGGLRPGESTAVDFYVAAVRGRIERAAMYVSDVTHEHRLPWPTQFGRDGQDGYHMMDAAFFDFTGDGLLDLVVVGQHSRVFSAVQHADGYFVDPAYHSVADEYLRVWGPTVTPGKHLSVPPCLYFAMEQREAWRPDHLECYDRRAKEWYEVSLPGGTYFMVSQDTPQSLAELTRGVMFWDMNRDGMIDFATRRSNGTWTAFSFVSR